MTSASDSPGGALGAASSEFLGKRIWVTGAGEGLGRAIALDLSGAGGRLALTSRSADAVDRAVAECPGPDTFSVPGSVADEADIARIASAIDDRWGGLDALVHCAGISPSFHLADQLDVATWRKIIDINLTGTFLAAQAAARLMPQGGAIVTISSVHAGSSGRRLAAYSASKGGVEALTRALALDWADRGIRVNCVAPGYFETSMTQDLRDSRHQQARLIQHIPLGALGKPQELTATIRLLVGPGGSYITGAVIAVDGGWTIF